MSENKEPAPREQTGRGQDQQAVKLETKKPPTSPPANQGTINENAGSDKFWVTIHETSGAQVVEKSRTELQNLVNAGESDIQVMSEDQSAGWKLPAEFGIVPNAILDVQPSKIPADLLSGLPSAEAHSEPPRPLTENLTMATPPPQPPPQPPEQLITIEALAAAAGEKKKSLRDILVPSDEMIELSIEPRSKIIGNWMRAGDLGYIFAPRGHGKTWLAMLLANSITAHTPLGEWAQGEQSRRLIYFDAEMNLPDLQERAKAIGMTSPNLLWLQSELIYKELKRGLNIADKQDQIAIAEMLDDGDVLIIDNLSTAANGMPENDNDAFDDIKGWLLELRGRKITVIIVHHAGRNGQMRGASRREDMAHWILSLKDDSGDGDHKAWITTFAKCRNCQAMEAPPLRWTMTTLGGVLEYTCSPHSGPEAMLGLIKDGLESATDLAQELGVTNGCVSKWAKKLVATGGITIENRKYKAT